MPKKGVHACNEYAETCIYIVMLMSSLVQEFKAHDKSRESIEMALDDILKQKMKIRHKYGFKPPKSGRRTDVEGDPTVSHTHSFICACNFAIGSLTSNLLPWLASIHCIGQ